jgi:16S rRNA processing protein RimM
MVLAGNTMAAERNTPADSPLVMGVIARPYGVQGWVHIATYTEHPENLLEYQPWYLHRQGHWQTAEFVNGRHHGKGLVVQFPGCNDRDAAEALKGIEIGIYRNQLPASDSDEYYWSDLVGLQVITQDNRVLGVVDHLIETGANDVLVVKGEQEFLVPFIRGQVVETVDLEAREIRVDWDPDY